MPQIDNSTETYRHVCFRDHNHPGLSQLLNSSCILGRNLAVQSQGSTRCVHAQRRCAVPILIAGQPSLRTNACWMTYLDDDGNTVQRAPNLLIRSLLI